MKKIEFVSLWPSYVPFGQFLMRREARREKQTLPGAREFSLAERGNSVPLAHEMKTNSLKALDQWNP